MEYLFHIWNKIRHRLVKTPHVFLGLDYDGTLAPIAKRPELAELTKRMRSLLKTLSQKKDLTLAILSGRALKDIRQRVRLKGIYYSGNHGFEIYLAGNKIISGYSAASLKIIQRLLLQLKVALKRFTKVIIENKGITLSVHYRNLPDVLEKPIIHTVRQVYQPFSRQIRLTYGKKVIEVKPRRNEQTKGKVFHFLQKLCRAKSSLPIYLGDDTTDEDVFRSIKNKGWGIYVGGKQKGSQARFFLKHQREVEIFLKRLLKR